MHCVRSIRVVYTCRVYETILLLLAVYAGKSVKPGQARRKLWQTLWLKLDSSSRCQRSVPKEMVGLQRLGFRVVVSLGLGLGLGSGSGLGLGLG